MKREVNDSGRGQRTRDSSVWHIVLYVHFSGTYPAMNRIKREAKKLYMLCHKTTFYVLCTRI